jgi:hypothetical protein
LTLTIFIEPKVEELTHFFLKYMAIYGSASAGAVTAELY